MPSFNSFNSSFRELDDLQQIGLDKEEEFFSEIEENSVEGESEYTGVIDY